MKYKRDANGALIRTRHGILTITDEWEEKKRERKRDLVRARVRTYREKHKEELRKARRVATCLMSRSRRMEWLARYLIDLLTPQEAKALSAALKRNADVPRWNIVREWQWKGEANRKRRHSAEEASFIS